MSEISEKQIKRLRSLLSEAETSLSAASAFLQFRGISIGPLFPCAFLRIPVSTRDKTTRRASLQNASIFLAAPETF